MIYLKTYESFDVDFKYGDIVICTHEVHFGEKFKVLIVYRTNLDVRSLNNGKRNWWSKDYFVKEKDWELYKSTQQYNI